MTRLTRTYQCAALSLWVIIALVAISGCKGETTVPPAEPYVAPTATQAPAEQQPTPAPVQQEADAARINGQTISVAEYQKQVAEWEAAFITQNTNLSDEEKQEMLIQGRRQVLDVMIEQMLIEQAAAREGVSVSDAEVESVIARDIQENGGQTQFDAWLQANSWTYDEYVVRQRSMMISSQMFERVTQSVPTKAEQIHARHILLATEDEARNLLTQLQGGADFAEVARQYSLDPSTKESGGDLGFFPRGTLVVTEVEDVAFTLSVGQISDVVHSAMGYHIVQVLERVQDMQLTEESWQSLREATFRDWVGQLWASANVEILIAL